MTDGGSLIRPEATGFGAVYYGKEVLAHFNDTYEGKTIAVSGYGSSSSSYGYGSAGRRKKQLEKEHYAGSCSDLT